MKLKELILLPNCPEWLKSPDIGIVFHHPDGRMAKIKKRDFGSQRKWLWKKVVFDNGVAGKKYHRYDHRLFPYRQDMGDNGEDGDINKAIGLMVEALIIKRASAQQRDRLMQKIDSKKEVTKSVLVVSITPFWRYAVGPDSQYSPSIPYWTREGADVFFEEMVQELPWLSVRIYRRTLHGLVTVREYSPNPALTDAENIQNEFVAIEQNTKEK